MSFRYNELMSIIKLFNVQGHFDFRLLHTLDILKTILQSQTSLMISLINADFRSSEKKQLIDVTASAPHLHNHKGKLLQASTAEIKLK